MYMVVKKRMNNLYLKLKNKVNYKKNKLNTEIYTLMSVDVSNYTNTIFKLTKNELNEFHEIFDNIVLQEIKKFKGKDLKKIGDCYLNLFKDASQAIECAISLQKFQNHNQNSNIKIRVKIALHTGEVIIRKNDIYGSAVNIVARMEREAKPYHIVFSESTYQLMQKKLPIISLGPQKLRGIKFPITMYRIKTKQDK